MSRKAKHDNNFNKNTKLELIVLKRQYLQHLSSVLWSIAIKKKRCSFAGRLSISDISACTQLQTGPRQFRHAHRILHCHLYSYICPI